MKIVCDKCNNEFLLKGDSFGRDVQMVQCPVCKTPIMVRTDGGNAFQHRSSKNRGFVKARDAHYETMHHDSWQRSETAYHHRDSGPDEHMQQDMMHQIENGGDVITSDDSYSTGTGKKDERGAGGLMKHFWAIFNGIDPYRVMNRYVPYVYYTVMMFVVVTSLFLFSDVIRLDNARGSLDLFLRSVTYVLKYHV